MIRGISERRRAWGAGAAVAGIWLVAAGPAAGQPRVAVEVSERKVVEGDAVQLRFVVETEDRREGRFEEPEWKGVAVVARSRQSRMQIVDMQVSRSLVYDFEVRADQPGVLVVPSARYTDRTGSGRSRPVNLQVEPTRVPPAPTPGDGGAVHLDGAVVAVVASVDRDEVWKGEQVTLTYTMYTRTDLSEYGMDDPELPGFWKEDLTAPSQPRFHRRVVEGVPYDAAVIREYLLFPIEDGPRFIPSVEIRIDRQVSVFRSKQSTVRSNPLNLAVRPLPPGAPDGFMGAVGSFEAAVTADREEGEVGQPVAVRIEVTGQGNLKHFEVRPPAPPDGVRAHPPSVDERVAIQDGRMAGSKVIEWILTPERAGRFSLAALRFPYFDPRAGEYKTAIASPVALRVAPSSKPAPGSAARAEAGPDAAGPAAGAGEEGRPPLRPLKAAGVLRPGRGEGDRPPWRRAVFWGIFAAPPALWLALLAADRVRRRREDTTEERVVRGALRRARRRLHDAGDYARGGRTSTLYGEVARTVIGYIDDRTGGRTAGLSFHELRAHLSAAGYDDADIGEVMATLEHCDQARFMPGGAAEAAHMRASVERAEALLRRLDRHAPLGEGG